MQKENCRYFETCSAPLCPEDDKSLSYGYWFPDEDVCRLKTVPAWVRRQRKISKKLTYESGCFTCNMLKRNFVVKAGTRGIDPDKGPPLSLEESWLKKHPEIKRSKASKTPAQMAILGKNKAPAGHIKGVRTEGDTQALTLFPWPEKEPVLSQRGKN